MPAQRLISNNRRDEGLQLSVTDSYHLVSTHIHYYLLTVADSYLLVSTAIYTYLLIYLLTVADAAVAGAVAGADPAPRLALFLQLARVPAILGALTQLPWE